MEKIVALVEGHTETNFVRMSYGNAHIQRPFANGVTVSIESIYESIVEALEVVSSSLVKVVILLDRERREKTSLDILQNLKSKLESTCANRKFYIGIPDIQIENWIMSDELYISDTFGDADYKYAGDGSSGKAALRGISKQSLSPTDTAAHLKAISSARAKPLSPSLDAFLKSIDFDWAWATS